MISLTSPLLAGGEIVVRFSVVIFVTALISHFGDQLKVGRR
jgi:hypothetical protein